MDTYREKVLSTIDRYEGRFVVIGGPVEVKEGNYNPGFAIMIEFPDILHAEAWYESAEYQEILPLRKQAAIANVLFMQGI